MKPEINLVNSNNNKIQFNQIKCDHAIHKKPQRSNTEKNQNLVGNLYTP